MFKTRGDDRKGRTVTASRKTHGSSTSVFRMLALCAGLIMDISHVFPTIRVFCSRSIYMQYLTASHPHISKGRSTDCLTQLLNQKTKQRRKCSPYRNQRSIYQTTCTRAVRSRLLEGFPGSGLHRHRQGPRVRCPL